MKARLQYRDIVRIVAALAVVAAGVVMLTSWPNALDAGILFVAGLALVAGVYVWPGVRKLPAKVIALVLFLLAFYVLAQGFGWLDLSWLRRIAGVIAMVGGGALLWPVLRGFRAGFHQD